MTFVRYLSEYAYIVLEKNKCIYLLLIECIIITDNNNVTNNICTYLETIRYSKMKQYNYRNNDITNNNDVNRKYGKVAKIMPIQPAATISFTVVTTTCTASLHIKVPFYVNPPLNDQTNLTRTCCVSK